MQSRNYLHRDLLPTVKRRWRCRPESISPFIIIILSLGISVFSSSAEAHLEHLPIYNGDTRLLGDYLIQIATNPEFIKANEKTDLIVSIQDEISGKDVDVPFVSLKIYKDDILIKQFSTRTNMAGDFEESYNFPSDGSYSLEVEMVDSRSRSLSESFNISVSQNLSSIYYPIRYASIVIPVGLLGWILVTKGRSYLKIPKEQRGHIAVTYTTMLSAVAAGSIHLLIYSIHASESIYYAIFFLVAGLVQISYGILYGLTRNKSMIYIGLVGTSLIIGLYIHSVLFTPPLSPHPNPDNVEFLGVVVKVLEGIMLTSIIYIILKDRTAKITKIDR